MQRIRLGRPGWGVCVYVCQVDTGVLGTLANKTSVRFPGAIATHIFSAGGGSGKLNTHRTATERDSIESAKYDVIGYN